jgi:hypothetical protein
MGRPAVYSAASGLKIAMVVTKNYARELGQSLFGPYARSAETLKFYLTVDQTSCLLCVGGRCNLNTVRAIQPLEHPHDKRDLDRPHRASAACRRRYKRHGSYFPSRNGGGLAPMRSFSSTRGRERPVADRRPFGRWMQMVRKFGVYAVIALVVPGGSLMAPALWAYRHPRIKTRLKSSI